MIPPIVRPREREVDADELLGGPRSGLGEHGGTGDVRPVRAVSALRDEARERGDVCSHDADVERQLDRAPQLRLELVVRRLERSERVRPDLRRRVDELRGPPAEGLPLRGRTGGFLPRATRSPRCHRHERRRVRKRQRGDRAGAGPGLRRGDRVEELVDRELEERSGHTRIVYELGGFFHAGGTFFHNLADVRWGVLAVAVGLHFLRLALRIPAWRSILRASYPESRVPRLGVFGSYVAGVGVNSLLPARSGDLLKLYLVKRRVDGSTYPTLGATLIVETLLDSVYGAAILVWALVVGVLPSLHVQKISLPQVDWSWPLRHPGLAALIGVIWAVVTALLVVIGLRRAERFWARVRQGFAILSNRSRFVLGVVTWQTASWVARGASIYFFLEAFRVPASIHNVLLVLAVQSISTLLPFTPGGVGTQQGFLVYVFSRAAEQIPKTSVLSFSIGMYVATTALNVVVGFAAILVMLRTLRWRRLVLPEKEEAYARGP